MNIEDFWNQFLPVFLAIMISGGIFTVLIRLFVRYIRTPKLKICLSIGTGTEEHSLLFYVVNTGKVGLMPNEMEYNIYYPFPVKPYEMKEGHGVAPINMHPYNTITGLNEKPILPGSSLLLMVISVNKNEKIVQNADNFECLHLIKYYYSITTVRGQQKHLNFFWNFFKKREFSESDFVKRPLFEITEKE